MDDVPYWNPGEVALASQGMVFFRMPIMGDILRNTKLSWLNPSSQNTPPEFFILIVSFLLSLPKIGVFLGVFCNEDVVKDMGKMDVELNGTFACQEALEGKFCALSAPWV